MVILEILATVLSSSTMNGCFAAVLPKTYILTEKSVRFLDRTMHFFLSEPSYTVSGWSWVGPYEILVAGPTLSTYAGMGNRTG